MQLVSAAWAMIREKGPRLILANVMERIVFDKLNGIDTITQVPKEAFSSDLANVAHGLHYSSSWTSEIRFGFRAARDILGHQFESYAFVDVGCGKGKVQIVWEQLLRRHRLKQRVLGLDYFDTLIEQANLNHRKVLGHDGEFIHADAAFFDYKSICDSLIIYIYNPFNEIILSQMVQALRACNVVLIYNNPVHGDVLLHDGFQKIDEKLGFHPQATTNVYARPGCN